MGILLKKERGGERKRDQNKNVVVKKKKERYGGGKESVVKKKDKCNHGLGFRGIGEGGKKRIETAEIGKCGNKVSQGKRN